MWTVPAPTAKTRETFRTCFESVANQELRERFQLVEERVVGESLTYEIAARATRLHTIPRSNSVDGIVSATEMAQLYTEQLARAGSPGREVYDEILTSPAFGRCPLCGQRDVSTLDHHLPKSQYPALSVTPINLVPACKDCNFRKRVAFPTNATDQTLNPYFDVIDHYHWLHASVVATPSATLIYIAKPPPACEPILSLRIKNHFTVFKLAELYAAEAAKELSSVRSYHSRLLHEAGPMALNTHLQDMAASSAQDHLNSWRTAMYNALSTSSWYCAGTFSHND